jgi:rubrerythrin
MMTLIRVLCARPHYGGGMSDSVLDPLDPRAIRLLSYYRDAELRGTDLLLHIAGHEDVPWARANLTRHISDEARHGWLITEHIAKQGAAPERIQDGYQTRMARAGGVPRTLLELYAATLVAERRAHARYTAHLASGIADPETAGLLRTISGDEVWHLNWVQRRLQAFAAEQGDAAVAAALQRYERADATVAADLGALEAATLGVHLSAPLTTEA